jgi:hypothetical protein
MFVLVACECKFYASGWTEYLCTNRCDCKHYVWLLHIHTYILRIMKPQVIQDTSFKYPYVLH